MKAELKRLQLQLTQRCNLRCRFCGQEHYDPPEALTPSEWCRVLDELAVVAPRPEVTLWDGEPLSYPEFPAVAEHAAELGCRLSLITNGTLIDRHAPLLSEFFSTIFVSVDGPGAVHDLVRGRGVFGKVAANLRLLAKRRGKLVLMSVLAPETMARAREAPYGLSVDRVILHRLIPFSAEDAATDAEYATALEKVLAELRKTRFPVPVEYQPHFFGKRRCLEPFRKLHVTVTDDAVFCTDFASCVLGNVRSAGLNEIFSGPEAERFRAALPVSDCARCSWRNTRSTIEHFRSSCF